jgi:DNA helicase-4
LDLEREKADLAKSWLINNSPRNGDVRTQIPDDEQAAAVAAVHGHIQVVARAGSGKTATLVNRAFFLIRHCRVAASQMLLLAFNRKAAQEMRRRLLGLLHDGAEAAISSELADRSAQRSRGGGRVLDNADAEAVTVVASRLNVPLPHVMTFHALAYAVVHPDATLIYNDAEGKAQALSSTFERVIREHLDEPHFKDKVRQLMLAHFRGDWDRIVEGGYDRSKEDLLAYRRSLPTESIRGEYV